MGLCLPERAHRLDVDTGLATARHPVEKDGATFGVREAALDLLYRFGLRCCEGGPYGLRGRLGRNCGCCFFSLVVCSRGFQGSGSKALYKGRLFGWEMVACGT